MRTTAPPTRREVMKPARTSAFGSAFFKTPSVSVPPRMEAPSVRTRWNSESRVSRRDFGKRRRLCIGGILICATAVVSGRASTPLPRMNGNASACPQSAASVQQKSSRSSLREDLAKQLCWLRRGRSGRRRRRIDRRIRLRRACRGRRRIHHCRIGFFLLPGRRIYRLSFLFASREQRRGSSQNADVFLHKL